MASRAYAAGIAIVLVDARGNIFDAAIGWRRLSRLRCAGRGRRTGLPGGHRRHGGLASYSKMDDFWAYLHMPLRIRKHHIEK
jgi:hypothetical protein